MTSVLGDESVDESVDELEVGRVAVRSGHDIHVVVEAIHGFHSLSTTLPTSSSSSSFLALAARR